MRLVRWTPHRNVVSFANEFDRFFSDVFGDVAKPARSIGWQPQVDVSEDKDNYYAQFELPGLRKDDISIGVEDGVLTVTGEKKAEKKDEGVNYHRVERSYGTFSRAFSLGDNIDIDKIDATFRDGVLKLTLPKAEKARRKEIDVKIK